MKLFLLLLASTSIMAQGFGPSTQATQIFFTQLPCDEVNNVIVILQRLLLSMNGRGVEVADEIIRRGNSYAGRGSRAQQKEITSIVSEAIVFRARSLAL